MGNTPFFVYGTLLPGQPNDHFWEDKVLDTQPASLSAVHLFAFPSFPMMVASEHASDQVSGQLVWVQPDACNRIMKHIDMLENYDPADHENSPYQRVLRTVTTQTGKKVNAWTYLGHPQMVAGLPKIPDGDWLKYVEASLSFSANQAWWRNRSTDKLF